MTKKLRNTDTAAANQKRSQNADEFAESIRDELNKIERVNNYKFQSLSDRVLALNHLNIKTRRGGDWTKTQLSRVLKRLKAINQEEI